MSTILNVTIEQSSKNILVDYQETLYDSTGVEASTQNTRKGYNPTILADWEAVEADTTLQAYAAIAWVNLTKPTEVIESESTESTT